MNKKQIYKNLQAKSNELVLDAINQLKSIGDKDAIPLLAELLLSTDDDKIKELVFEIFSGLKDTESIPEVVKILKNNKYQSLKKELVTSCWQSGLNYSAYLEVFVDITIDEQFETAFEAFTVIDEMTESFPEDLVDTQINKLLDVSKETNDDKASLIKQLLNVLVEYKKR